MPDKDFPLEPGGAPQLGVSWHGAHKDLSVSFDGRPVAAFEGPKELKEARRVALPDGSTLEVRVASPFGLPELLLNLRRLVRHVREKNPAVAFDDDTLAFAEGTRPPARFAALAQLAEYDAGYGIAAP